MRKLIENKEVLKYCPHFSHIINFKYKADDLITDKLITVYRDFIFKADIHNEDDRIMVKDIDHVLNKYIDDFIFRKELKTEIVQIRIKKSCQDIIRAIVENILNIFNNYLYNTTRKIKIARWI